MKAPLMLTVVGTAGQLSIVGDFEVEALGQRIQAALADGRTPKIKARTVGGAVIDAPVEPGTVRLEKLSDGRLALFATVELPDDAYTPAEIQPPRTGLEVTEEERARTMPELERQLEEAEPE